MKHRSLLRLAVISRRHANVSSAIVCLLYRKNKFDVVDFQNATLSGGVAVGAIADLMIQPGGAFIAGSLCGVVSTLGYRVLQVSI